MQDAYTRTPLNTQTRHLVDRDTLKASFAYTVCGLKMYVKPEPYPDLRIEVCQGCINVQGRLHV